MSHEPIHSGHFMTSNPHTDPPPDEEDEDVEVDVVEDDEKAPESLLGSSKKAELYEKPVTFYKFGPKKTQSIAIDVSLNKLNKCIKVAYNKMTTPKWKDFKGLRLHWKQRIRLNNVIWRAYYMEFRKPCEKRVAATKPKRKTPYCYFSVPDDDNTHSKLEGSLVEGMYWKRKMEAVCAQYKRWRHFFKNRKSGARRRREASGQQIGRPIYAPPPLQRSQTPKNTSTEFFDADDLENVFTDELFDSLNQPYMFPNPREMMQMQSGNADIMQPGLLSLQPSLEEIMTNYDNFDDAPPGSAPAPPPNISVQHAHHNGGKFEGNSSHHYHEFVAPALPPLNVQHQRIQQQQTQQQSILAQQSRTTSQDRNDYSVKDFVAANMLLDYSNQTNAQPTRQSSLITSQMLMSAGLGQPQYSQAQYDQRLWKGSSMRSNNFLVTGGDVVTPNMDYMPQFLSQSGRLSSTTVNANNMNSTSWARSTAISQSNWLEHQLAGSPLSLHSPLSSIPSSSTMLSPPSNLGLSEPSLSTPSEHLGTGHLTLQRGNNIQTIRSPVLKHNEIQQASPTQSMVPPTSLATLADRLIGRSLSDHVLERKEEKFQTPRALPNKKRSSQQLQQREWTIPSNSSEGQHSAPSSARVLSTDDKNPWTALLQQSGSVELPDSYSQPSSQEMISIKEERKDSGDLGRSSQMPPDSTLHPAERKRILHLHAEQNRRSALKDGFEQLMDLIPDLYSGGVKPTNAVVLAKACEEIRSLQSQREKNVILKEDLREKVSDLNGKIAALQSQLPSGSVTSSRSSISDMKMKLMQFSDRYTKDRARDKWQYWILSKMIAPMIESFSQEVHPDPTNRNEISISTANWFKNHWKVQELRPLASNILVYLATNTRILSDATSLEAHVKEQIRPGSK